MNDLQRRSRSEPTTVFGREMTRALDARGLSCYSLGKRIGVSSATLRSARRGVFVPSHPLAVRIAEELDWPKLARISLRASTNTCRLVDCGREFVARIRSSGQEFCSRRCQSLDTKRRERGVREDGRKVVYRRLREAQAAIDDFCNSCEPVDKVCRDAGGDGTGTCPLRSFSPFPFVPLSAVDKRSAA